MCTIVLMLVFAADPIIAPDATLEKLWSEGEFTEGPAYGPDGRLYFSDIGNRIMVFDPETGQTTAFRDPSGRSNGLIFDSQGRLFACEGANTGGNRRISVSTLDGKPQSLTDRFGGKRYNSPNDLIMDAKGRIYFSDPRYVGDEPRELDHESVFRIDPDGSVTRVVNDVDKPNGLVISADQKTLYVAENDPGGKKLLLAYPLHADGTVGKRKVLHDFGSDRGIDGMAVDVKGRVFATAGQGKTGGVTIFAPDGEKLGFIPTPETPTNCCFGGADRNILYVTAGKSLYRIETLTQGLKPPTWPVPKPGR